MSIPVLRKDFTVSANDVCDARLMGADCVLLIVAALSDGELAELSWLATEIGLDALVETHDAEELRLFAIRTVNALHGPLPSFLPFLRQLVARERRFEIAVSPASTSTASPT